MTAFTWVSESNRDGIQDVGMTVLLSELSLEVEVEVEGVQRWSVLEFCLTLLLCGV